MENINEWSLFLKDRLLFIIIFLTIVIDNIIVL